MHFQPPALRSQFLAIASSLLICSALVIVFQGSEAVFDFAILFSGLLSLYLMYLCVWNAASVSMAQVYGASILLAYGLGALTTVSSLYFQDISLTSFFEITIEALMVALAVVLAIVAWLILIGNFQARPIFDFLPAKVNPVIGDLFLPIFVIFALLISYATGSIGLQGIAYDDSGTISSTAAITTGLAIPATPYCVYLALNAPKSLRTKLLLIGLAIFILVVPMGRRVVLYTVVQILMAARLGGWTVNFRSRKVQIVLALGLAAVWFATRFFYAMRLAKYQMGYQTPLDEALPLAFNILLNPDAYQLDAQLAENTTSRTFILEYLALLTDRVKDVGGMMGEVLWFNFRLAVPAAFDPNKWQVVDLGQDEEIVHPHLNLPVWDAANSVLTTGVSDFYIVGMFLYPLLFLAIFTLLYRFMARFFSWPVAFFSGFLFVNEMLNVEATVSSYFSTSRNIFIVALLLQFFYWIRRISFDREHVSEIQKN